MHAQRQLALCAISATDLAVQSNGCDQTRSVSHPTDFPGACTLGRPALRSFQ